jgi:ribonuclease P protein component
LVGIQREGKQLRATLLAARSAASPLGYLRAGIVVPKYGRTAVKRNKLKRQLRELTRLVLLPLAASCDVIVRARDESYSGSFEQLKREIERIKDQILKVYGATAS